MDKLHEESRKQFEGWFKTKKIEMMRSGASLLSIKKLHKSDWEAWQASRASIVVDVPEACAFNLFDLVIRDDVIDSLRSTGLSIKGE